jgi:hypothetical protein
VFLSGRSGVTRSGKHIGGDVGCDGPLRTKARNQPGTRGRKPAAPAPRFAAYPGCLRAFAATAAGRLGPQDARGEQTIDNDNKETLVRFAACIGGRRPAPPTLAHPVSLWGLLDPALLSGVILIETTWCRETIVKHSPCRSRRLRAAVV